MTTDDINLTASDRGFDRAPEIVLPDGTHLDVYEASTADAPHVWLKVTPPGVDPGRFHEDTGWKNIHHMPVEAAWQLVRQLAVLVAEHYHGEGIPAEQRQLTVLGLAEAYAKRRHGEVLTASQLEAAEQVAEAIVAMLAMLGYAPLRIRPSERVTGTLNADAQAAFEMFARALDD